MTRSPRLLLKGIGAVSPLLLLLMLCLFLLIHGADAADAPKAPAPGAGSGTVASGAIDTDAWKVALATAQRDFWIAKSQYEAANQKLEKVAADAGAACQKLGKTLDATAVACVEAPKPSPPK